MKKYTDKYSLIRFLHAVPRVMPVDIYLNGSLFFNRVFFTHFSPYLYVPEGVYEVTVFITMTKENPIIRQNIEVKNGELATLTMTGNYDDIKLLLIPEDKESAVGNNSKIRFVHLSPNVPELNVLLDNVMMFSNVDFREITEYVQIPTQFYQLDIELSQNNRLLRSNRIAINPNRIYTLYVMGNFASFQVFQSLDGATFINPVVRYK
ncbi:DUF4397 domain-containing protein [Romboutsia sp.]|uniref:DUF4397 domain-containing protein n=1 Tax=Romboutsia sp. TaxID=1965302 RepID=UPI002CE240A0|nr:DUF4397 domain-containing protein [Romboutsia sp.]HSQ87590.1 DUF4397 domain-containing protein [Romboutsia sp.]